jgi:hypothetical protein
MPGFLVPAPINEVQGPAIKVRRDVALGALGKSRRMLRLWS